MLDRVGRVQAVSSPPWGANRASELYIALPSTWRHDDSAAASPVGQARQASVDPSLPSRSGSAASGTGNMSGKYSTRVSQPRPAPQPDCTARAACTASADRDDRAVAVASNAETHLGDDLPRDHYRRRSVMSFYLRTSIGVGPSASACRAPGSVHQSASPDSGSAPDRAAHTSRSAEVWSPTAPLSGPLGGVQRCGRHRWPAQATRCPGCRHPAMLCCLTSP
jgi:hypothetical protein